MVCCFRRIDFDTDTQKAKELAVHVIAFILSLVLLLVELEVNYVLDYVTFTRQWLGRGLFYFLCVLRPSQPLGIFSPSFTHLTRLFLFGPSPHPSASEL